MDVLGFDIGGANTKAAFITSRNGFVDKFGTASKYFPIWKNPEKLESTLIELTRKVSRGKRIDLVSVTMTAELSDAYSTKREGVNQILSQISRAFPVTRALILGIDGKLRTIGETKHEPTRAAASNWAATGWMMSQVWKDCVAMDVGSTTTSIIPVLKGVVSVQGKTDLEKLACGELVYTGSLRTNVAAITNLVPTRYGSTSVSSEHFAQSADVHLVLNHISEKDYSVETSDKRGKTRKDALARLARVVCADTEMLSEEEILEIANYIYIRQVDQIAAALGEVRSRVERCNSGIVPAIVTGVGRRFLGKVAFLQAGFPNVVDFGELAGDDVAKVSTAFAAALMGASYHEKRVVRWTR